MEQKNYTIKDIAKLAGVSAGTVDRVLHHRGEVSESSREKVQKVLDEINYQPNMFAIGLAAKKRYTIYCLVPYYIENDYWYSVAQGIKKAAAELQSFNVRVEYQYYSQTDEESYVRSFNELIDKLPDAVLIAPNFHNRTIQLITGLNEQEIPFAFIDYNIEDVNALKYIGQDSCQSGYLAAKILMHDFTEGKELVLFLSNYKENPSEMQMQRRLKGFMQYIDEECSGVTIHEVVLNRSGNKEEEKALTDFFHHYPNTKLGVVFNSRVYKVGNFLRKAGIKMDGLIGYDLLPGNVNLLKSGEVTYLIGQRPGLQGYWGVKSLSDYVVFKKSVEPVKYMPIDVLMKDNIDYYFEFE